MSRIGRAPIALPAGVTFDNTDNLITVKGPLGTLTQKVDPSIEVVLEDGHILVKRHSDDKDHRALHGLYRALIHNMVTGVTKGFEKNLIVAGVGYKVTATPNKLTLNIGFGVHQGAQARRALSRLRHPLQGRGRHPQGRQDRRQIRGEV